MIEDFRPSEIISIGHRTNSLLLSSAQKMCLDKRRVKDLGKNAAPLVIDIEFSLVWQKSEYKKR